MKKVYNKTNACLFFLDVKKFIVKVVKLPLCNNKHKTVSMLVFLFVQNNKFGGSQCQRKTYTRGEAAGHVIK